MRNTWLVLFGLWSAFGGGFKDHSEADKYIFDTLGALPEDKRDYWSKRVYSCHEYRDKIEMCQELRRHFDIPENADFPNQENGD